MRNLGERTVLAVITVFLATLGAAAGPVVKGDPRAYAEIKAAFVKFLHVKSFRSKQTAAQEMGSGTGEFVSPDRYHMVQKMGGVVYETIYVGKGGRMRQGGGPWQCLPEGEPISFNLKDMEEIKGEVTAAKGPVVAIDGVQTQSYTYSTTNENGKTSNQKLFVALTNGLPKRIQELDKQGAVKWSMDYFDYNAPITITLPPCT